MGSVLEARPVTLSLTPQAACAEAFKVSHPIKKSGPVAGCLHRGVRGEGFLILAAAQGFQKLDFEGYVLNHTYSSYSGLTTVQTLSLHSGHCKTLGIALKSLEGR